MKEPELHCSFNDLNGKRLYFASDFHLGIPNAEESKRREKLIVKWLQHVQQDAAAIFLVGDLFDFWFEYKKAIPKGFVRFQGKIAELSDQGIPIYFFAGNHDLWMSAYFQSELNVNIIDRPITIEANSKKMMVGHGDGLGPGSYFFKTIKKVFKGGMFRWMFQWIHPNVGVSVANFWSSTSRKVSGAKDEIFLGEEEKLYVYCKAVENICHHDFYIFGHRHLPLEMKVSENSTYFNLGEWVNGGNYLEFDGNNASLKHFGG